MARAVTRSEIEMYFFQVRHRNIDRNRNRQLWQQPWRGLRERCISHFSKINLSTCKNANARKQGLFSTGTGSTPFFKFCQVIVAEQKKARLVWASRVKQFDFLLEMTEILFPTWGGQNLISYTPEMAKRQMLDCLPIQAGRGGALCFRGVAFNSASVMMTRGKC